MTQLLKPGMLNFKKLKLINQKRQKIRRNRETLSKFNQLQPESMGSTFSQFPLKRPKTSWKICGLRPKAMTTFTNRWWAQ